MVRNKAPRLAGRPRQTLAWCVMKDSPWSCCWSAKAGALLGEFEVEHGLGAGSSSKTSKAEASTTEASGSVHHHLRVPRPRLGDAEGDAAFRSAVRRKPAPGRAAFRSAVRVRDEWRASRHGRVPGPASGSCPAWTRRQLGPGRAIYPSATRAGPGLSRTASAPLNPSQILRR